VLLTTRRIVSLAATGALLLQLLGTAQAGAALSPNGSIFFFKPGHAMTGTLKNGVFHRQRTFATTGWTAAAATRDSLALYNKATGKLKIGTFRGGIFTAKHTRRLLKGYTRLGSTCDSLMLYNGATGRAVTATLTGGELGARSAYSLPLSANIVVGACKGFYIWSNNGGEFARGTLEGGLWTQSHRDTTGGSVIDRWAMTADSSLYIRSSAGGAGEWDQVEDNGQLVAGGSTDTFGAWDIVAGTGNSVLFYIRDGIVATGVLSGGNYTYIGSQDFSVGWTIVAGGR
jgi:hypothetical protein